MKTNFTFAFILGLFTILCSCTNEQLEDYMASSNVNEMTFEEGELIT